jgi:hypothetical protein
MASQLFNGKPGAPSLMPPNVTYAPARVMQGLRESPMFKQLSPADQNTMEALVQGFGFENGTSMAFPYMAPDNNNTFFADVIAKFFIVNRNANASKKSGSTWQPPGGHHD